jgi:ANTAR domain
MEDTLARALNGACANLDRTAIELGATSATVVLNADKRFEIAHQFLNRDDASGPSPRVLEEAISRGAPSFLVRRWQANPQAVAIVLGFDHLAPWLRRLPDSVEASLELIAFAFWSTREIGRLHAELKAADRKLSGRKLVERAKGVLQVERGISEESAYAYLRGQSRNRRVTLARIAEEVLRVNGGFDRSQIS